MPSLVCICQICNCGRHRCPHRPPTDIMNKSNQPCALSEYKQTFKKHQTKPRSILKPPQKVLTRDVKMECQTINKQDFVAHPVTPPKPKSPAVYKPVEGVMDTSSEYKVQFVGKWAVPVASIRPQEAKRDTSEKFSHKTTQSTDFVAFPVTPREIHGTKYVYESPTEPFNGTSTIQSDFVDFGKVEPTKSLKPFQKAKISSHPFEGTTSYSTSFTPQRIPERFQRPKATYIPSGKEFYGKTTFKSDFPAHPGAKPSGSLKPPQKAVGSESPFDGTTTSRLSYKSWDLPTRYSRPPTVYSPPSEKFAAQSTFQSDFPDYGRVKPPKSIRPPPSMQEQVTSFESLTTQKLDFKAWTDVSRPTPVRREKKYSPPTEKFDALSTVKDHYRGEFVPRAASTKPPNKPYTRSNGMDYTSSYRESYSAIGYKPCPSAALLSDSNALPEYAYSHQDVASGHKFFVPTNKMVTV